jgi:hypothetical protein
MVGQGALAVHIWFRDPVESPGRQGEEERGDGRHGEPQRES